MVLAVPYTVSEDRWNKYNTGGSAGIQKGSNTWNQYHKKENRGHTVVAQGTK